jgi:branched-chain amino acid transport system ATP-binding protein
MAENVLKISGLKVAYGGIQAVKGIDLAVGEGELVCLIGANGAGKTTTLKGICGMLPIKSGAIRYAGEDITGSPSFRLVRRGLAMVPEGRGMFGALTIEENLAMGAYARTDRAGVQADVERMFGLFPRLKERRRQTAGTLSGGEQQMLAMARALATEPRLLALDEPAAGMNATETAALRALLESIRRDGTTILLIEHDMKLVMSVCDRVLVLDYGKKIAEGVASAVQKDEKVIAAYLGGEISLELKRA